MRRFYLPWGRNALLAIVFLVALLAFLPLRVAISGLGLADKGLTARSVEGNIWFGRIDQARIGGLEIGDVRTTLNPLALLIGRARLGMKGAGSIGKPFSGTLISSRNRFGVSDLNGATPLTAVGGWLPVSQIHWNNANILFEDQQCSEASGNIQATLGGNFGGFGLSNMLNGTLRCDGTKVAVEFAGDTGVEKLVLRVDASGNYDGEFAIESQNEAVRAMLSAQGFRATGTGFAMPVKGRF